MAKKVDSLNKKQYGAATAMLIACRSSQGLPTTDSIAARSSSYFIAPGW